MKISIKIIITVLIPLVLLSCGFKAINQKNSNMIYLQNIKITGDRKIAYTIKNNILLISSEDSTNKYDADIKISKDKIVKIKNSAGKIIRYNLSMSVELQLKSLDDDTNIQRMFKRDADYEVADIHSETINNEQDAIKINIQQLSDDIISFITIYMNKK
jgi:carbon monoxide dehydrogenase subunit G